MEDNMKYNVKDRNHMKTIDVIFVSDELVGTTIVSKKEYERLLRAKVKADAEKGTPLKSEDIINQNEESKTLKRKGTSINNDINSKCPKYIDDVELALAALENDDVEKITVNHPSMLYGEYDVSAKRIFNFENNINCLKRGKSIDGVKSKEENSVGKQERDSHEKDPPKTPNNLRKKFIKDIKEIQKILENSDEEFSGSESDSSYNISDDSLSDSSKDSINSKDLSSSSKSFFKGYYDLQSTKKSKCIKAVKKVKTPKLTQEKLDELVKNFQTSSTHINSIKVLLNESFKLFEKWDFILEQNYNLLLYGAGSKREILKKFVDRFVDVHPVIVVNGFFPDVSSKEIVEKICSILKIKLDSTDAIDKIQDKIQNYDLVIYLAINNIDGIMLRNHKVQSTLSQLGKLQQIRIVASIDHINAPLIWDKSTSSDFNWVWYDVTTFLNYEDETVYEGNIMLQNSGKATLISLRNVFNSLTKNSRGIFMIMLKNQLEPENKKSGISFRELYQKCRKELLISSDVALRAQLKEFIDHMVLKQKRNADGEEQFVIVIENNILRQFLEEQEGQQN